MLDFKKIQVVSTQKERQIEFIFPKEGWFVGASNCNFGADYFLADYLYHPNWSGHNEKSFGGYTFINKDGELKNWWTFNCCFSDIETQFLYFCKDEETAEELANLLNSIPTKSILKLNEAILEINKKIESLLLQRDEMMKLKKYVKNLTC